jgi:hypothetical protein
MKERKVQEELAVMRHHRSRRRAKRGLVAGYIHELSARHAQAGGRERPALAAAAPDARG